MSQDKEDPFVRAGKTGYDRPSEYLSPAPPAARKRISAPTSLQSRVVDMTSKIAALSPRMSLQEKGGPGARRKPLVLLVKLMSLLLRMECKSRSSHCRLNKSIHVVTRTAWFSNASTPPVCRSTLFALSLGSRSS